MPKIKNYVNEKTIEIKILIGWDCADPKNAGYTATVYRFSNLGMEGCESIILDDEFNVMTLSEVVGYFATEYLPREFHDLNQWSFKNCEMAQVKIACGYWMDIEPPKELPKIKTQIVKPGTAKQIGFARFNNGDHLCVDVPDGHSTISVRLSDGRQITFAFCPYSEGGVPKCVDVRDLGDPVGDKLGTGTDQFRQNLIGFSGWRNAFRTSDNEKPCTLLSILLKEGETDE
tara:strand:+ start:1397 stop:2086 length:690 start_codon:yes stop_codon:yes gene_type:complete